ncbi:MAG: hypothetical protein JXR22_03705, partial [Prolixibacteraceae bacterium]|nr:hypothetical protein [Prolixibacteraceae bacterium]
IVARLGSNNNASVDFRLFDQNNYWTSPASFSFGNSRQVVVPLDYSANSDGVPLNTKHIYIAGFWSNGSNPFVIDTVFLSNSSEYDAPIVVVSNKSGVWINSFEGIHYKEHAGPSAGIPLMVLGDMLQSDVLIAASNHFEISLTEDEGYEQTLFLAHQNGFVPNTEVFVRLKEGLERKSYSGALTISTEGFAAKNVSLAGFVDYPVGIDNISGRGNDVVSVEFFTLSGQKLNNEWLPKGVVIERKRMSDGSIVTSKSIVK